MAGLTGRILDSLSSLAGGLGVMWGARRAGYDIRTQVENDLLYRSSWLVRKVHDIPPYDMTRAWRAWQTGKDTIQALEAEERRLRLRYKVRRALTLARLHGGGALILGLPGNSVTAVTPDSIAKGGLGYVHAVSRHQLTVTELERDALSPHFGEPKFYTLTGGTTGATQIHPSRVIPFVGQPLPEGLQSATADDFWGDPLLQSLGKALNKSELALETIADLLAEAKIDVISIPGLMEIIGDPEYEQKLLKRLTLAQSMKSTANALLIAGTGGENDPGEKWETRQMTFTGLPDLARVFLQVASGAADIPATRLLNQSPDGMNATGESDLRNYYDMLAGRQEGELTPALDPLDDFLIRSALGRRPTDIFYNWRPLWQLSPEKKAEVDERKGKTVQGWSTSGLIPARALEEAAQNMLIEDGMLPGLEAALEALPKEERFPSLSAPDPEELEAGEIEERVPGEPEPAQRRRAANDASPRTLYVRRDVINAAAILAHFETQDVPNLLPPTDLHVTIAYSRNALDWMEIAAEYSREPNGHLSIQAGGPRVVERLGAEGMVVLMFNSWELGWRHGEIRRAGASWDYSDYQPHISFAKDLPDGFDLEAVKPWTGVIELGEEIFEEIDAA